MAQDVRCCLDLQYIDKILPLPLLEMVPGGPVYFAGLMNLKNKCIPVFDLAICTGLTRDKIYPLNIPILLCSDKTQQVGLIVDKVLELGMVDSEKIEIRDEFVTSNSPFLGAITLKNGVSLLINANWLFALKLTQDTKQILINHE